MSSPKFGKERIIDALWQVYANVYDGLLRLYPYRHLLEQMAQTADVQSGMRVIDAGCGTGNMLAMLQNIPDVELIGVDASSRMLRHAPRKFASGHMPHFVHADVVEFLARQPAQSADVILLSNVLYAIEDRAGLWAELLRVAKPRGCIVVTNSDRGGSAPIIREHMQHASFVSLLHPRLVVVGVVDALISMLARTGQFAFLGEQQIRAEVERAGGQMSPTRRCYGGEQDGVNLLFSVTRPAS